MENTINAQYQKDIYNLEREIKEMKETLKNSKSYLIYMKECLKEIEEQQQKDILHSQSVWKIYFGAVLQDIREPNWREEEQYKKVCDEDDCDTILDIDTPIMCYMNKNNGDKTLCRDCYVDGGYKEIDENSDNEDSDSDDEEEEENTCWCEVGEHRVSELDMWKDFADCKNCVSEKEMLERTVDDEED